VAAEVEYVVKGQGEAMAVFEGRVGDKAVLR
jgi:hypothetical protein